MRLKILALAALCLVSLIAAGTAMAAGMIGDTLVPFSADRTAIVKGKTYQGRVYAAPGVQRHEQEVNGFRFVAIVRLDRGLVWLMLPELHVYTPLAIPAAVTEAGSLDRLGRPIGRDEIAGLKVDRYHLTRSGSDGSTIEGSIWMTDSGIVVKLDGTMTPADGKPAAGTLELANIRRERQDPTLFDLPRGMAEIKPEMIETLMNLRLAKPKG
jgi:hypothetical protein